MTVDRLSEHELSSNSAQLSKRRSFHQKHVSAMCLSVPKQTKLLGDFRSCYCCGKPRGVQGRLQACGFPRVVWEALQQKSFANTKCTNDCVHVTELSSVCLGGSETYSTNPAVSSEAGSRFATIAWLRFLFGLDPVIFLCNGCEEATEIGFLC